MEVAIAMIYVRTFALLSPPLFDETSSPPTENAVVFSEKKNLRSHAFFSENKMSVESNEDVLARLIKDDPSLEQFLDDQFQSDEFAMKIVKSSVSVFLLSGFSQITTLKHVWATQ